MTEPHPTPSLAVVASALAESELCAICGRRGSDVEQASTRKEETCSGHG